MDHSHASVSKNKHQAFKMENVQITANKLLEKKNFFKKIFFQLCFLLPQPIIFYSHLIAVLGMIY